MVMHSVWNRSQAVCRLTGAAVLVMLLTFPASAQSVDANALNNRLLRLENEFRTLSQQVYRGQTPPTGSGAGEASGPMAGSFEVRLSQLETELRNLTGRVEELQFAQRKLQDSQNKQMTDVEFRLGELEKKANAPATPVASPPASIPTPPTPPQSPFLPAPEAAAPTPPAEANRTAASGTSASVPTGTLPVGDAQKDYDQAYALLRQADYAAAEKALKDFVVRYPKTPLTGNAQYWLAETYYVRGQYSDAALAFGEGFEKYPDSSKAPDNLLKLGLSLVKLNKLQDACRTFNLVGTTFPDAPEAVRQRAEQEKATLNCR